MLRFSLGLSIAVAAVSPRDAAAQKAAPMAYMQIFYEGSSWLLGRRVLSYSPAFRGKTQELASETDSTRQLYPNTLLLRPEGTVTETSYATMITGKGTFISDKNGKMRLETAADRQQARLRETEQLNRSFRLLEARADLGRSVLAKALNEAAADGWEVVQMTAIGTTGGLVYLLRRR